MSNGHAVEVTPDLYRQVFEVDKRGAAILENLALLFSKGAEVDGDNAVLKTYHNLGSTKVVQFIVGQINMANDVTPLDSEIQTD